MADLYWGLALVGTLAAALLWAARAWARRVSPRWSNALALAAAAGLGVYIHWFWQHPALAAWWPYSNLVIVGNPLPPAAALLAGLAWGRLERGGGRWSQTRGRLCGGALAAVAGYAAAQPLLGAAPACGDEWSRDGICLQTTEHTCGPAAAATLLREHGIAASEQEMAELCLTREGSSWMGLYRGLKQKTAGTPWEVEVVAAAAPAELQDAPLLALVGLPAGQPPRSPWSAEYGFRPGVLHVVVLRGDAQRNWVAVEDPTPGIVRERWPAGAVEALWRGPGLRLVPRDEASRWASRGPAPAVKPAWR